MLRFSSILAFALLLMFTGCEKDDTSSSPSSGGNGGGGGGNDGEATFTADLNGETYTSAPLFIGSTYTNVSGIHSWGVAGLRTNLVGSTETINVVISTLDSTDFAIGTVFNGLNSPFQAHAAGTYSIKEGGTQINAFSSVDSSPPATCTITAIDTDAKTWSATFIFAAEGDNGQTYIVTDGEFTNVSYE